MNALGDIICLMKTKTQTPSVVPTSSAALVSGFTLGLDLGDRQHHVCVLDAAGQIIREASLPNTRPAFGLRLRTDIARRLFPGGPVSTRHFWPGKIN
jgi:hypothetical protein